jgi:hypothetical protein
MTTHDNSLSEVLFLLWPTCCFSLLFSYCFISCFSVHSHSCSSNCLSKMTPTLTCVSSRATQACCVMPLHASMKFWEVSFVVATSFLTSSSCSKISSTICIVRVMSFSSMSCASFFNFPSATTNSPITLSASSYNGANRCWRIFYWSLIFSISLYECLCAKMVVMHSAGGSILMFFEAFCTFSCASLNIASIAFIYGSSINFFHICVLSSYSFLHSSSNFLIFSTMVILFLSICSFSSGGVPSVHRDSKY